VDELFYLTGFYYIPELKKAF